MKSVIVMRDGRRVDLWETVDAGTYAELEGTQGKSTRKDPLLFCGGCGGGLHVRHGTVNRNELFGAHFDAGYCTADLTIRKSAMTPQHRRMQEYTARAAGDAGFGVELEVPTSARTRVDVVVDGRVGIEVQWSGLTAGAAVRRTARSMSAGLETVAWCAGFTGAPWAGKVPGYQWMDVDRVLEGMPNRGSVRSRGLLTFRAERMPGGWAPVPDPLVIAVDEAVTRMAAGTVRPVMYRSFVQLVRDDGLALYEEITGRRLEPFTGPPPRALRQSQEISCLRPPARSNPMADEDFWCETCGSQHPLREHRECRRRNA